MNIGIIIILLLLCVGVVYIFLNNLYKRTNHFNNQFVDVRKYWDISKFPKDLELINLGSNHPKFALDYSECNIKALNCAVGPQTFEYDFAILRKITPYLSEGAKVVIPICLLKFWLYRQDYRGTHVKYYTFLPSGDIVNYSKSEYLKTIKYPLLFNPRLLRYVIRDIKKDSRLEADANPLKSDLELKKDADLWINCWNKEFGIELPNPILSKTNKESIEVNVKILQDILEYCKLHGFKPIIAILPVTSYLLSKFTKDFIQSHILRYINEANVVDAPLMNYLSDDRFISPNLYFNSFFMNKIGRKKFTEVFVNDVYNIV